jgi:hypothetical protein
VDYDVNEEEMSLLQSQLKVVEHRPGLTREADAKQGSTARMSSNTSSPNVKSSYAPVPSSLKKPVWVHIPKCGSSFAFTLLHHACGTDISSNLSDMIVFGGEEENPDAENRGPDAFGTRCPGNVLPTFWPDFHHSPLHSDNTSLESVVTMIRDPRERLLSAYQNGLHGCREMHLEMNCFNPFDGNPAPNDYLVGKCDGDVHFNGKWIRDPSVINPVDYAKCVENCSVNMLSGNSCEFHGSANVDLAVSRVENMGFVGLTDEWDLSICLFHAKFGGPLLASELENSRPGPGNGNTSDVPVLIKRAREMLDSWPATNEMRVYKAAVARFWREIKTYQLTAESCQNQISAVSLGTW